MATVCLTFDHLGSALEVGRGTRRRPDPAEPGLAVGYPRILALLAELELRATFFVEGWSVLHHPDQVARLLDAGHEVALHGWVHEPWSTLGRDEQERVLGDGLAVLRLVGVDQPGFRAPHGVLAPETPALLGELGYQYDSSLAAAGDDPPARLRVLDAAVVNVPFRWPMVDAWQYRLRPRPLDPPALAAEWLALVRSAAGAELVTLVAHPHVSGVDDERFGALTEVLRALAADPAVSVRRAGDLVAEHAADGADVRGRPGVVAASHQIGAAGDDAAGDDAAGDDAAGDDAAAGTGGRVPVPAWADHRPEPWAAYLRDRGLPVRPGEPVRELTGGVSYVTLRVGELVVKRPRAMLAVAAPWPAAPERVLHEAAAMRRFADLAPPVLDLDVGNLVLTLGFVGGDSWKDQLLAGDVDLRVVRRAAEVLRRVHAAPLDGVDGRDRFEQLRLAPYFESLPRVLPDVAADVEAVLRRLRATRTHLVHGDYSPKNVLVRAADGDRADLTVLDWEVACAGDPAFDVAFLMTHLLAKAVHLPAHRAALADAAAGFLRAYGEVDRAWLARLLGAMLLARTDGLSRLGYLDDAARAELRERGTALLRGQDELPC